MNYHKSSHQWIPLRHFPQPKTKWTIQFWKTKKGNLPVVVFHFVAAVHVYKNTIILDPNWNEKFASVVPKSGANNSLDVALVFTCEFTCQIFDQAGGGGTRLFQECDQKCDLANSKASEIYFSKCFSNSNTTNPDFTLKATPLVSPKMVNFAQKHETQHISLGFPSLPYWFFSPLTQRVDGCTLTS